MIADKIFDRHLKALLKRGIIDADKVSPEILKKIVKEKRESENLTGRRNI